MCRFRVTACLRLALILLGMFEMTVRAAPAGSSPSSRKARPQSRAVAERCLVTVDAETSRGVISPLLMGFNLVYYLEYDALWADGRMEALLKQLKCGALRFPGGEITSYYHWDDVNGRGEVDSWDPEYQHKPVDGAKYMDLAEYMGHVRAIGCEPVMGVNIESGAMFGRDAESLEKARALIQHCVDQKYNIKYWFIDNESYLKNPGTHFKMPAQTYANYINQYANVLKSVDPNIKIIANWAGGWNTDWQVILPIAGDNIDIADFHFYWRNGGSTWDAWLNQSMGPAKVWGEKSLQPLGVNESYEDAINNFRSGAKSLGFDIEVAVQEWNVGPEPKVPLSQFQTSLMQAEEFGQFIHSGVMMSCFWPLHWSDKNDYRMLVDHDTGKPHPNAQIFQMYSDALGQEQVTVSADTPEVFTVAARSNDGKTLFLYLLRKSDEAPALPTTIDLKGFAANQAKAVSFTSDDLAANDAKVIDLPLSMNKSLSVDLPAHSFTQITLSQ